MEHIVSTINEICNKHEYSSCKEFMDLLDSKVPYNLFVMKLADITREIIKEAKKTGRYNDYEILEGIIGDLESSIEYDI
ncbi:MAG: hypothetical protein GSR79_04130 [Desulfurococcales archaeon]|nr:hypothetical protein [Desulfurococcales archaeon]